MIAVEEALDRITAAFAPLSIETVGLGEALGRVLAEDVMARIDQPPAAVSAMDGYALRAADLASVPAVLDVIGEAPAGDAYRGEVGPGQAVRIFTGGPLPRGADSVVIQEDTDGGDDRVTVKVQVASGNYVRAKGLDFRHGSVGLKAGRQLTARDVGLAAAMNVPWLRVRRRPRVAILSTGNELVLPGEPLAENQIIASNGLALSALVTAFGGLPIHLGIARDDGVSLGAMMAAARGADILVTSGGASVGKHDLVRQVLDQSGWSLDFWRVAMRPGKPLLFGRLGETPVLGLPGNPVSSVVCALLFLRPAMDIMHGLDRSERPQETARLAAALEANDRRQDYLRAHIAPDADGQLVATPFPRQDSSMLATLAHADGLIVRPPLAPPAAAGDTVAVVRFADGGLLL